MILKVEVLKKAQPWLAPEVMFETVGLRLPEIGTWADLLF